MKNATLVFGCVLAAFVFSLGFGSPVVEGAYHFENFEAHIPMHIDASALSAPKGITPEQVKKAYHLPATGGKGVVAIVDAFADPAIEGDLAAFDKQFNLPDCSLKNGCLEVHAMGTSTKSASSSLVETALDVEWAHAIAPQARVLLVEAKSLSGENLLKAVDYAVARPDVVSVSMSWGGAEFPEEVSLDAHFSAATKTAFFAASGDSGSGASWPASSPYVIGVGGTKLELSKTGAFVSESAWSGSGGGVSAYEAQPDYQKSYDIPRAKKMRAIPDVSYDADPKSGFPVYATIAKTKGGWYLVGGTSAGTPQWAAIQSLGQSVDLSSLYADKASSGTLKFFRDITSGKNGTCTYYCDARKRYDYITGLGSPLTVKF